ncbi:MAG: hypothetical protein ACMZ64_12250 [Oleiphilus sp.]
MPVLEKKHVKVIETVVRNDRREVKRTELWDELVSEYGIGRYKGDVILFSRSDLEAWVKIVITKTGYDPLGENISGNRTEVSDQYRDEKWATEKVLPNRVLCTSIGGVLKSELGSCTVIPEVEYRIDYRKVHPKDYDGILVVENLEAFVFIHQFKLPDLGHVLVLYRGNDESATAMKSLLNKCEKGYPVYWFPDFDPAGLGMVMDSREVTHAILPIVSQLTKDDNLPSRFDKQIVRRPRIKEQARTFGEEFSEFVAFSVNKGIAVSQEKMCAKQINLTAVPINDQLASA